MVLVRERSDVLPARCENHPLSRVVRPSPPADSRDRPRTTWSIAEVGEYELECEECEELECEEADRGGVEALKGLSERARGWAVAYALGRLLDMAKSKEVADDGDCSTSASSSSSAPAPYPVQARGTDPHFVSATQTTTTWMRTMDARLLAQSRGLGDWRKRGVWAYPSLSRSLSELARAQSISDVCLHSHMYAQQARDGKRKLEQALGTAPLDHQPAPPPPSPSPCPPEAITMRPPRKSQ
uniref:Uncharacterized protein n=1 Tax=Mycena chlorophos TaxID=658473 RepID=A0ABQ0KV84_MYCCL|nr:predicted protein [Mycena chlorophos]